MSLSRREFLRLTGLVAGSAAAASCGPIYRGLAGGPEVPGDWPERAEPDFRALRRLTFGPTVSERRFVLEHGLAAWIEEQLSLPQDAGDRLKWLLRGMDSRTMDANQLAELDQERVLSDLRAATTLRRIFSAAQLRERMVEFWSDHFNIYVEKTDCWYLKPVDDRAVIRTHALGSFHDLLWASAHSPAMLVYLDNQANHWQAPNENYARELMELHTLSVDGGYSQRDVMELARCLTGWTVKEHFWKGDFTFDPDRHDPGEKTVLRRKIKPAGVEEAEIVLGRLAKHTATAEHLAFKLVQKFICDDPVADAPELVGSVALEFEASGGSITAALRKLLLDGMARGAAILQPKFKRPTDYVLSALRMLGAETDGGQAVQNHMQAMGLGLFAWPTPDGPPETSEPWRGNLLPRWQFAFDLARGEVPGTTVPVSYRQSSSSEDSSSVVQSLSYLLLGGPLPQVAKSEIDQTLSAIPDGESNVRMEVLLAGLLSSPAFQWR